MCQNALQIASKKHSKLHQKCSQNCIRNVRKMVQKLCAKTVCKLCCKNCIFLYQKKVLQSDANEHFTRVSSRARKQTNEQTNKRTNEQTNKTPYGVMEKMYRKEDAEEEEKTKVKSERARVTDVPVFG